MQRRDNCARCCKGVKNDALWRHSADRPREISTISERPIDRYPEVMTFRIDAIRLATAYANPPARFCISFNPIACTWQAAPASFNWHGTVPYSLACLLTVLLHGCMTYKAPATDPVSENPDLSRANLSALLTHVQSILSRWFHLSASQLEPILLASNPRTSQDSMQSLQPARRTVLFTATTVTLRMIVDLQLSLVHGSSGYIPHGECCRISWQLVLRRCSEANQLWSNWWCTLWCSQWCGRYPLR